MGVDILDIVFRLERTFGVRIDRESFIQLFDRGSPPDITVGRLFEFVRGKAIHAGVFDEDIDAEMIWLLFRQALSDALGIEPDEITKDKGIVHELGAW